MSLPSPRLDDRTFDQLVADAIRILQQKGKDWTDLTPSDPGIVLLELFAYLTEVMLFRLNRLPEKAYIEFLRLLGVTIQPPSAAGVDLVFKRKRSSKKAITIPRGIRVTVERTTADQEAPIFVTNVAADLPLDVEQVTVRAYHYEQIEGELLGRGTGLPGQSVRVARAPILAPIGDPTDLVVAVEATPEEIQDERTAAILYDDRPFRIWREVEHFSQAGDDPFVYVVDRTSGRVTFAPAVRGLLPGSEETAQLLAEVPGLGREIRAWYRRGGGLAGNVAAGVLTLLKDRIQGVDVTNPERATGGREAETLENALLRGPEELHSLRRAVTARDFERIAINASSRTVARAKAFTSAELWAYARPGLVEVLLVPEVAPDLRDQVTASVLEAHQTPVALSQIQRALDERRPLGTMTVVTWARYKSVRVRARVIVQREENPDAVRERIVARLRQRINPYHLPFGEAIRASLVYDIALSELSVRWLDGPPVLIVDQVPSGNVQAIAIDHFQAQTWYAGSDSILFRSLNNGAGWEPIGNFGGSIISIEAHPQRPGLLAVAAQQADGTGTEIKISNDSGETWNLASFTTAFRVYDLAWMMRNEESVLLMATDVGLFEFVLRLGSTPVQILVNPDQQDLGFYSVITHIDLQGVSTVAVAAEGLRGVFLSNLGGATGTFRRIRQNLPDNEDIRVLAVQYDGPRAFLWAGAAVTGTGTGNGCYRWELRGAVDPAEGWLSFKSGWGGGSVLGLAFHGTLVFAASHRSGVLALDSSRQNASWPPPDLNSGLPLREAGLLFQPVEAVAASPSAVEPVVMAGGSKGIFRSTDGGKKYHSSSTQEFTEKVTEPPTWLFVSGEHEITVVSEDAAQ
jgi:hypothetical protein